MTSENAKPRVPGRERPRGVRANPPRTRIPAWLKGLSAAGLAVILVAVVFEVGLRLTAPRVVDARQVGSTALVPESLHGIAYLTPEGKRLYPNRITVLRVGEPELRDIEIRTNSLGFRDSELAGVKSPDEFRILMLGDSITMGSYLMAHETISERMQERLRASGAGGLARCEVINAGIDDAGLDEEIGLLADAGISARPDFVIINLYLNDTRPPWGFPGELGSPGFVRKHSLLADSIYRRFRMKDFVAEHDAYRFDLWLAEHEKREWLRSDEAFLKMARAAEFDWGAAWGADFADDLSGRFARLSEIAATHGLPVQIVVFPVAFQIQKVSLNDSPQRVIERLCGEFGFQFLDLLPPLRHIYNETGIDGERMFIDQCHPTARTAGLIGMILAEDFLQHNAGRAAAAGTGGPARTKN